MNHTDSVQPLPDEPGQPSQKHRINDAICRAFGAAVRDRRLGLKLSQSDLADRAGLHRNYVGGVERGERNLSLSNVASLAEALGVASSTLLAEAEQRLR